MVHIRSMTPRTKALREMLGFPHILHLPHTATFPLSKPSYSPLHFPSTAANHTTRSENMSPPADRTKRTSISCDRCQKRKVKCQDPVPGPCRACRRGGHSCKVSRESRSRPFYQVSQEQFDLMIEVIKEYEPDLKLDLSSLRARKQARSSHNRHSPTTSGKCAECSRRMPTPPDEQIEHLEEVQEAPVTIDVSPEMEALDGESVSVLVDTEGSHSE